MAKEKQKKPNILVIWGDEGDWFFHNGYFIFLAQAAAQKFAETFKEFPAIQPPNTFTIDDAIEKMSDAAGGANH